MGQSISLPKTNFDYQILAQDEGFNTIYSSVLSYPASSPTPTPTPTPPPLPLCFGANNIIDSDDLQVLAINYLNNNGLDINNGDNKINSFEFAYLVSHWGKDCAH